ncbi:integrase arm-type DNA-binding domain-containing protein [Psychrobacter sp. JB193]|uniref:tyrosine-type recombinase/integrase n=1 Tax=Psychrobacter sp. JB193 TaxID=2024406 RepID=UPI000BAADB2F|nr:integrase arm-type DNA-binding domain-containing protein [Psychrobacter sp. JB193]PAT63911.1 integrase [Psychrobacter sp. JB193]
MARITNPLTNTEVAKAKPKDKPYRLYDGNGLVLNVAKSGTKTWYYQYSRPYTGIADMFKLGRYPALSLADARKKRAECDVLIENNVDPKTNNKDQITSERNKIANDFKSVFNEWLSTKSYSSGTLEKMQSYISEVLIVIGNKPVSDVTTADCLAVLRKAEKAGHLTKLQKMRTMISQVMAFAIATGRTDNNPALHLRGVFKSADTRHNPAILDEPRLTELVQCIDGYHGHLVTRKALEFALLTFARPGEVRHLKWVDVDFEQATWTYTPSKTMKSTKVKMVTPLSSQALQILAEMREYRDSELAFPSVINASRPLSENTLNQALRRMGFVSSEQTSHGFRAIARTLLEEKFKFDYRIIEMQLGHSVRDSNGRAYNRVQFLEERLDMMQKWADYLDSLKSTTD